MKEMYFGFVLLFVVLLSSCSIGTACTEEFRFITLQVQDEANQQVSGVSVTVTLERTGTVLEMGREQPDGTYLIADDSLTEKVSSTADTLTVTGSKDNKRFQTQFQIRSDGCHIKKVSGLEIIILK